MKQMTWTAVALLSLLAAGCWQKSVYPFFQPQDLVSDSNLQGVWLDGDPTARAEDRNEWQFTVVGAKAYRLVITDDGTTTYPYEARLFRLGTNTFLDIEGRTRAVSSLPAHHLFKVQWLEKQLNLHPINAGWIRDWLKSNPASLSHIVVPDPEHPQKRDHDDWILTAPTKHLQQFVQEHMTKEGFFGEPSTLRRQ